MMVSNPANALSIDYVSQAMLPAISNAEQLLRTTIEQTSANASPAQLIELQRQIQQWTLLTQLQSTVVKELADAAKSVIQKAA